MSTNYLIVSALEDETSGLEGYAPIVHTGLGKVNASIKLSVAIQKYKPELVINYGTAGALGDLMGLYHIDTFVQHDMDVRGLGFARGITPFSADTNLPVAKGVVLGSGDSFITDKVRQLEGLGINVDLVDMEAFALREVCQYFSIPFICYKYVTDSGDGDAAEDWRDNVTKGTGLFSRVLEETYGVSGYL